MYPIATFTVGAGGQDPITFTNIPQNFSHLQLRIFARSASLSGGPNTPIRFNGDTGNNYIGHYSACSRTGTFAANFPTVGNSGNFGWVAGTNTTSNIFGCIIVDIFDYSNTVKNKTWKTLTGVEDNAGGTGNNLLGLWSGLWMSTAAINSITITGHTYAQGSTFQLYGISNSLTTGA